MYANISWGEKDTVCVQECVLACPNMCLSVCVCVDERVCACVCACERERDRVFNVTELERKKIVTLGWQKNLKSRSTRFSENEDPQIFFLIF